MDRQYVLSEAMKIFWKARLVGYAYDLDQKKDDHAKTLQQMRIMLYSR